MITKTLQKNGSIAIGFYTEALPEAVSVQLVGSFDDWQGQPMRRLKDGRFMKMRYFSAGERHEFRYLVDGAHWINDAEAEGYSPNPYGSDNCVVTTDVAAPS
jgi:1,4-alpha-glucan branching enzyme